ncbi:hypothetical protein AN958_05721 [Leucoagaricus sp. SymC.cos]|nr:hypothetical protein AN958_05721 [Leucoagaricus sp. SymC.cos]
MPDYPSPYDDKLDTLRTNFVGFASLTALVWDHIDTFADEVEYIWKGHKGPCKSSTTCPSFLQNRYFTPLGFIFNLHAYLSPVWTVACSMVFDHSKPYSGALASASAWIPLLYDTIIFVLTLHKTVPPLRRAEASYIITRLLEDGLLYYSVIVSVTLVLTIMIIGAPEGTKNIAAQITVAMMSRITLNLRKAGRRNHTQNFNLLQTPRHHPNHKRSFWLLRLFPNSRRAIQQFWERNSFFQWTYDGTATANIAFELTTTGQDEARLESDFGASGYGRRNSLGILFVNPDMSFGTGTESFPTRR